MHQDRDLSEAIRRGDHKAFERFFRANWSLVFRATQRMTVSDDLAKDLTQEAFIQVWNRREHIDPSGNLLSFVFTIIRNNFLNYIRRENLLAEKLAPVLAGDATPPQSPYDELATAELQHRIDTTIARMPDGMRRVWVLSRTEGLSTDEIARQLAISPLTVKKQLSNALRLFRETLLPA